MISMIAMLRLRRKEPELARPFRVPLYPFFPVIALVIASGSFAAVAYYNPRLVFIYFFLLSLSFGIFKFRNRHAGKSEPGY